MSDDRSKLCSKVYNEWNKGVEELPNEEDSINILRRVWTPKVKWFKPPMWKIFSWAYKINETMYMNCYPTSCDSSLNIKDGNGAVDPDIKFSALNVDNMGLDAKMPLKFATMEDKEKCRQRTIGVAIENEFSNNDFINIWAPKKYDPKHYRIVYRGEVWAIPDEYLNLTISRYINKDLCITENITANIYEGDVINILVKEYSDDIVCNLPKKKHDISNCADGGKY